MSDTILARFVATHSPDDNTELITLGVDATGAARQIVRGGDPMELTPDEFRAAASTGHQIEIIEAPVSDEKVEQPAVQSVVQPRPAPAAPTVATPTVPPATPGS